ncbi:restriction endonuclease [Stutzerimonas xanthomarina]|uniref:restriction endonuclease n=1 Tax=Stutzerimonas xanthomarina TaxID=271420 RepID=UPI0029A7DC0A|nr:restriction endonuclease [Stutzerimonas xanthomarina]MDX2351634.1 restriction endonuclease [Stutzerimonas xanthomarina]
MQAFVLRIAPSGVDLVHEALETDEIIIGWCRCPALINESLRRSDFRSHLKQRYYPEDSTLHRAGAATGHMWRFLREMNAGDLVVVPHGPRFHIAEITGDAYYTEDGVIRDAAFRRPVKWLNDKKPIPRRFAKAALISRMKIHGASAEATDLISEIKDALERAATGQKPSFQQELQSKLTSVVVEELRKGHMDSFGFEHLIKDLLKAMGAQTAEVIGRRIDKGADILATFRIAEAFSYKLAVQAKHWDDRAAVGPEVVQQLIDGIEDAGADLGMVITSGEVSQQAYNCASTYTEETGVRIELVDCGQFAKMLVEQGIGGSKAS